MNDKLNEVIAQSGIWSGARRQSHGFLLSPSVYEITETQRKELSHLGQALHDCLLGMSHIAVIAYDNQAHYRGGWLLARRVFGTGVPTLYQEFQAMNKGHIPKLLKVDLMVDQDGIFKIAEIDGHNKHGLGYSTLGLRFREALYPDAKVLPGAVKTLAGEVKRLGYSELKLLYGDQERFYVPEFEIASQEFLRHGINCRVVSEMKADTAFLESGLFLDLPFLYQKKELYEIIANAYRNGKAEFIIPPKPFMGAKGVLAILRNDLQDEHLESVLRSFIDRRSLDLVRSYIPATLLVGKQATPIGVVKEWLARKKYVLKESISSGMKGVTFSDEESFDAVLSRAYASNMNWILQEEVANKPQTFSWFENGSKKPELKTADDWFMRVTTQYVNRQLADVIITARRDKAVHGAKDCIQIGTVVV